MKRITVSLSDKTNEELYRRMLLEENRNKDKSEVVRDTLTIGIISEGFDDPRKSDLK